MKKDNMDKRVEYLYNLQRSIQKDLDAYNEHYQSKTSFGVQNRLLGAMRKFYSVAILKYLVEGDRHAFFECCYNASACFDMHNRYCMRGMPNERRLYSLINSSGLFCAMLSRPREKAKTVVGAINPYCRYGEDEFSFNFFYGLGAFFLDESEDAQKSYLDLLIKFRDEGSKADIEIGIYEGLINKDKDAFVEAMAAYLARREKQITNHENVPEGSESICIEALALIRLAQELGIDVKINHRLTPLDLQGDYPELSSYKRAIPKTAQETRDPEFWKDWSPVEDVL
jgi:hypothetical protein